MLEVDHEFTQSVEDTIRASVTSTISVLFDVPVDVCSDMRTSVPADSYICCGEFIQDDTRAILMFSFDRSLIQKLAQRIFSADEVKNPGAYESTATEIVNIVSNHLKTYLNVRGYKLHLGMPYIFDRTRAASSESPLIHMAFSLKNVAAMGVDFYLRSA